ncbi:MAG: hypothetical protein JWN66_3871 [Sphingomonas bacterium]|uniref:S41 family peptidase n=1 Tax=Sphingomonas bacterium TaxID=1895847 RepID=UPI002632A117|nr:S41 family peptidase [Sphingomonas bacterium]MDB5706755.1 hypothetical protein [Sphingomonas bacterium]
MRLPLVLVPLLCLATAAGAQTPPPGATVTPAARAAVVDSLGRELKSHYVFPETAAKLAAALSAKLGHGDYDTAATGDAFGDALTRDLHEIGKDAHFRVMFDPDFKPDSSGDGQAMNAEQVARMRQETAQRAFGINRVQRLPGNVGYLDIRGFGPTAFVAPAYSAAITLLSGTDALIIDLRQNGGGEPESVAWLLSHFFTEGDARHLNDIYSRPDNQTRSYWTDPAAPIRYTRPIYVLTSHDTFSGGEECAYDLQTQKRATLIGETTGGGANPGDYAVLGQGFIAFIPSGRAINPITKTNWEHVGVTPDVAVPAAGAMKTAYATILKTLVAGATDPRDRAGLAGTLAALEKDEIQLPVYTPRR